MQHQSLWGSLHPFAWRHTHARRLRLQTRCSDDLVAGAIRVLQLQQKTNIHTTKKVLTLFAGTRTAGSFRGRVIGVRRRGLHRCEVPFSYLRLHMGTHVPDILLVSARYGFPRVLRWAVYPYQPTSGGSLAQHLQTAGAPGAPVEKSEEVGLETPIIRAHARGRQSKTRPDVHIHQKLQPAGCSMDSAIGKRGPRSRDGSPASELCSTDLPPTESAGRARVAPAVSIFLIAHIILLLLCCVADACGYSRSWDVTSVLLGCVPKRRDASSQTGTGVTLTSPAKARPHYLYN